MKSLKTLSTTLALASFAFFSLDTQAVTQTITQPADWYSSENDNLGATELASITGHSGLTLQYKAEVGGNDGGLVPDSYDTTFVETTSGKKSYLDIALVNYLGGTFITGDFILLVVKDGNKEDQALWDISDWNGTDNLRIETAWTHDISNLTIWTESGGNNVPDGGATAALLGIAMVGFAAFRRKS